MTVPLLVAIIPLFLSYSYAWVRSYHENPAFRRSLVCDAKAKDTSSSFGGLSEKTIKYLQVRDMLKNANGTGSSPTSGKAKDGYKKFVGKGLSLDQKLRAVIAYKRSGAAQENYALTGLTADDERELDSLMEDDSEDYLLDEDEAYYDDEEAEYESLVMKAIEQNKLNEIQRNFILDKAAQSAKDKDLMGADVAHVDMKDEGAEMKENLPRENTTAASDDSITPPIYNVTGSSNGVADDEEDDLYTPARSSWGVFKRPRDISKTYGGGRVITKEEMDRMSDELEQREREKQKEATIYMTESMKKESDNAEEISSARTRARGLMSIGDRRGAVDKLESVRQFVSWNTEVGGEVLLELAMALETVNRSDDARDIYGRLASVSWSQKIRKQSLMLLSGLDMMKQIRKDTTPQKPMMDMYNMKKVADALRPGLTNAWNDYDKDKRKYYDYKVTPWNDDGAVGTIKAVSNIDSFDDAYNLFVYILDPLKTVQADIIAKAFRKTFISSQGDIEGFLLKCGKIRLVTAQVAKARAKTVGSSDSKPSIVSDMITSDMDVNNKDVSAPIDFGTLAKAKPDGIADDSLFTLSKPDYLIKPSPNSGSSPPPSSPTATIPESLILSQTLSEYFFESVNGTWELVETFADKRPYQTKRSEYGALRRTIFTSRLKAANFDITNNNSNNIAIADATSANINKNANGFTFSEEFMGGLSASASSGIGGFAATEVSPTFWGLSTLTVDFHLDDWNAVRRELTFSGDRLRSSVAPWVLGPQDKQLLQVTYCDDKILITRQASDAVVDAGASGGSSRQRKASSDVYTLWKRVLPTVWRKY